MLKLVMEVRFIKENDEAVKFWLLFFGEVSGQERWNR